MRLSQFGLGHLGTFLAVLAITGLCLGLGSCAPGKDKTVRVYDEGTKVELGHLIYTVFETQWLPQIGTGENARVPRNRFFLVRLSAVNSGSEEMDVPNLTLKDDQGHIVEESSDGEGVPQWIGYVRRVRPADSISGNIIFDADPKHYQIRLTDEDGEKSALVDLPLNFSAPAISLPTAPSGSDFGSTPKGK